MTRNWIRIDILLKKLLVGDKQEVSKNELTIGIFQMFLTHTETKSAAIIFNKLDLITINSMREAGYHNADDEIKRQLTEIRKEDNYQNILNTNNAQPLGLFEKFTLWLTPLLIKNK